MQHKDHINKNIRLPWHFRIQLILYRPLSTYSDLSLGGISSLYIKYSQLLTRQSYLYKVVFKSMPWGKKTKITMACMEDGVISELWKSAWHHGHHKNLGIRYMGVWIPHLSFINYLGKTLYFSELIVNSDCKDKIKKPTRSIRERSCRRWGKVCAQSRHSTNFHFFLKYSYHIFCHPS